MNHFVSQMAPQSIIVICAVGIVASIYCIKLSVSKRYSLGVVIFSIVLALGAFGILIQLARIFAWNDSINPWLYAGLFICIIALVVLSILTRGGKYH